MSEQIRPDPHCERCGKPFPVVEGSIQYRCAIKWNDGLRWPVTVRLCDVCWQTSEYRMPTYEQVNSVLIVGEDE